MKSTLQLQVSTPVNLTICTEFHVPGGKIMSGLGVSGAVESGKPVAIGTVGTA